MATPTTMTTSMITTATTMMTDVVVVPSLEGLLVGCVLLLTGTVPVVVIVPTVWGGMVVVGGGLVSSGVDAVVRKHITSQCTNTHSLIGKWVSQLLGLEYGMVFPLCLMPFGLIPFCLTKCEKVPFIA